MYDDPLFTPPTEVLPAGRYIWNQYIPEHFLTTMKNDFNFDNGLTCIREKANYH